MHPVFFATPLDFRRWLTRHHRSEQELWVGFYKKATGRPSITWQEALDEALCVGWIDGIRKRVDDEAYTNRFTPRRAGSKWSAVNTRRAKELVAEGRMRRDGLKAFNARDVGKTAALHRERTTAALTPALENAFKSNRAAWQFFAAQPPGYRRLASFYVMGAKREATRIRRLERLMSDSAQGRRIGMLQPKSQ